MSSLPAVPAAAPSLGGKYLTVILADEAYGISVLKVREIIRIQKITLVPLLPGCVAGVINLRGRVVPIVDLRIKLGLEAGVAERTCIVVVHVSLRGDAVAQMGLIVDAVEEVANLTEDEIEPTPDLGATLHPECILGMAKVKGQVKTLLDIDRVIGAEVVRATARVG